MAVEQSILAGADLSGSVPWEVTVTGPSTVAKVDFFIDGVHKWSENYAPFVFGGDGQTLDTKLLANGVHQLRTIVTSTGGTTDEAMTSVRVTNATPAPPPVPPPVPPPPTPTPGTGPSGIPVPASDPAGWTRIFTEDFSKANVALGTWPKGNNNMSATAPPGYPDLLAYPYPWHNNANGGLYDPSRVLSIHNSMLDTFIHSAPDGQLIGTVQPVFPHPQKRLRLQWCTMFPIIARCLPAFLLWPDSNTWPRDGEIDFPEGDLSGTGAFSCFVHLQNATDPKSPGWQVGVSFAPKVLADSLWHVYTLEWVAGQHVTMQRDDGPAHTVTSAQGQIPNTPMHFEHQTDAAGAKNGQIVGSGHILTDWLTICN